MGVKYRALPLFIVLLGFQSGCGLLDPCEGLELPADQSAKVSIAQGIWGHTWFWEGAQEARANGCGIYPSVSAIASQVLVYPQISPLPFQALDLATPGYHRVPRSEFESEFGVVPAATVFSDHTGFFQVGLEPGTYAVLVAEGDELAASFEEMLRLVVEEGRVFRAVMDIPER